MAGLGCQCTARPCRARPQRTGRAPPRPATAACCAQSSAREWRATKHGRHRKEKERKGREKERKRLRGAGAHPILHTICALCSLSLTQYLKVTEGERRCVRGKGGNFDAHGEGWLEVAEEEGERD
jgi:hypothetical protein